MFEETLEENSKLQEESLHLVTFELSGEEFGVDIMQVSEVILSENHPHSSGS